MVTSENFPFVEFKDRLSKLKRLAAGDSNSFTLVKDDFDAYKFITYHFYTFMKDKKSHTDYPASICELLCFFILRCNEFTFVLDSKPMCFNIIDIAENLRVGRIVNDYDYSEAISTLYCELIDNMWHNPTQLLGVFIESIEKDPWHISTFTNWQRTVIDSTSKEDEDLQKEKAKFYKNKPDLVYTEKNGKVFTIPASLIDDSQRLRQILKSNEYKNELVRQRALENFKSKFSASQFEKLEADLKNFEDPGMQ